MLREIYGKKVVIKEFMSSEESGEEEIGNGERASYTNKTTTLEGT